MIIVLVEVGIEAGTAERVRDAVSRMEQETRREAGCMTYAFSVDVSNSASLRVTECWRSLEDLAAHLKAPHMAAFGAAVAEIQPKSMSVKAYEVAREVELPR